MSRPAKIRAAWFILNADDVRPSRRKIQEVLFRNYGVKFNNNEVSEWLKTYQFTGSDGQPHLRLVPVEDQVGTTMVPVELDKPSNHGTKNDIVVPVGYQVGTLTRADLEKEENVEYKITPAASPPERPEKKPRRQREAIEQPTLDLQGPKIPRIDDPTLPSWVLDMRSMIQELVSVQLRDLTKEQRFKAAMYHAWRWANCTKNERANRKHAGSICAGISNLSQHKQHGNLTLGDYVDLGDELWKQRGMTPWYKPWDVTGQVESALPTGRQSYVSAYQGR